MTHTFFLAHPEKEASAILIGLRDGTKRKTVSTGITIRVSSWDKANKTIIKKSEDGVYLARLTRLDADVAKLVKAADASESSLEELYKDVLQLIGKKEVKEDTSRHFLPFYQYWASNNIGKHKATRHTKFVYNVIEEFVIDKKSKKLTFNEVDYNFFVEYLKWLQDIKEYATNTCGAHIKLLRAVMNEAYKRELHSNMAYKNFTIPKEKVDSVYLTKDEYDQLYKLELKGIQKKARDLFLIGCYTALRVSDYSKLTMEDIRDGFIYIEQTKTKDRVVIPVHHRVMEIMQEYNGVPKISEQKLNIHIKEVCKLAGFTEKIGIKENGEYIYKEKYELVSSHTARRSAATNMALNGTPLRDIMQITGHKTESSLLRYIKITDEQNARRLASNPFFL